MDTLTVISNDLDPKSLITTQDLLVRLLGLYYELDGRSQELGELFGENCAFLNDELQALHEIILDASGATARKKSYLKQLVALGAREVAWACLESPDCVLFDFLVGDLCIEHTLLSLADYVNGNIDFKVTPEKVAEVEAFCKGKPDVVYQLLTMDSDV